MLWSWIGGCVQYHLIVFFLFFRNDKSNFEIKSSVGNSQGSDLVASNNEGDEKEIDDQAPTDKETSTKDVHVHISQAEEDSDIRTSLMKGLGKCLMIKLPLTRKHQQKMSMFTFLRQKRTQTSGHP